MNVRLKTRSDLTIAREDRQTLTRLDLELLGERLRRVRLEKKLSQRDVCQGLFTSAYLSSLELGKTRPTFETLLSLAERLDKSVDFFLCPPSGLLAELRISSGMVPVEMRVQDKADRLVLDVFQRLFNLRR